MQEFAALRVHDCKSSRGHKVIEVYGKGGKERLVPMYHEAEERLEAWLDAAGICPDVSGPLFRPANAARGGGRTGFAVRPIRRRAVQMQVEGYVRLLKLDPNVTAHSLRVTAFTTACERGSDIIDLRAFAGHADPRTTLTYIGVATDSANRPLRIEVLTAEQVHASPCSRLDRGCRRRGPLEANGRTATGQMQAAERRVPRAVETMTAGRNPTAAELQWPFAFHDYFLTKCLFQQAGRTSRLDEICATYTCLLQSGDLTGRELCDRIDH